MVDVGDTDKPSKVLTGVAGLPVKQDVLIKIHPISFSQAPNDVEPIHCS